MDDWLARVLDLLDKHKLLDDTQVVVTSDHGENFGEGGLCGHSFSLDDRSIRVPAHSRPWRVRRWWSDEHRLGSRLARSPRRR